VTRTTARGRRLLFVVAMLVLLTLPLASSLWTRAKLDRAGQDVVGTVGKAEVDGDRHWIGYTLPEEIDPDHRTWTAEVDTASYAKAAASKRVNVRVLPGRPEAHRVEGQIDSRAGLVVTAVADVIVLGVGLLWVRVGRRRPAVRMAALGDLEPVEPADVGGGVLTRAEGEHYEAVGEVTGAGDDEVILHVGDRDVVVLLRGYANPVPVGSSARARGPLVG
jgi:hypothetical protein